MMKCRIHKRQCMRHPCLVYLESVLRASCGHLTVSRHNRKSDRSPNGSLLRTRQKERDVVDFSLSCHETAVLPTWGTTELLQAQGFGQAFLDEALGGDHGGGSIRTRTLGGIQEYELLDLLQLFLQIFDGDRGPEGLGLAANVVQQGETQQAVKSVHADLAVGPVIQGLPVEPVAFLEAPENLLDRLL